jgi:hypothetical protein
MYTDFLVLLVESPELNDLMIRGRSNIESLDREGYRRFSNLALISFSFFSAGFFQYKKGTLSDDDWTELSVVIEYWVRGEGCRDWWKKMGRQSFGRPFVEFIESEIAQVNPE